MGTNSLKGRKQSPEHIAKRMDSVARTKALWTDERRDAFRETISRITLARDPSWREKVSISRRGIPAWNKGKNCPTISANHWNLGGSLSQEHKAKLLAANLGKKQSPEHIEKRFASRAGYHHSEETKAKISRANSGEGNGNWLGGLTPYPTTYFKARDAIRERDGHRCVHCGSSGYGKRLDVHHIDYDKKNIAESNLVTLCHFCHGKTNHHRKQWQAYFDGAPQFQ